jgi:oligopeptide transport system substrate-binding protein
MTVQEGGALLLSEHEEDDEEEDAEPHGPPILLRGETAAQAVARFSRGLSDLVVGGTVGSLPIVRAAEPAAAALRYDPVAGLFGLVFTENAGLVADPGVRRALSMAIDRDELVAALGVPELQPRPSILPPGLKEQPEPALPDWSANPLPMRREQAAELIAEAFPEEPPSTLRVAVPEGPGYRLIFAHLRRDWRAIGIDAERVGVDEQADLRLIDKVAPATLAEWYLRHFTCDHSPVCSEEADILLETARNALPVEDRHMLLAGVDSLLTEATIFIPLTAPVRWSLVSPRLTGFQINAFNRHLPGTLVVIEP